MSVFGEIGKLVFKTKQGSTLKLNKRGELVDPDTGAAVPYSASEVLDQDSLALYEKFKSGKIGSVNEVLALGTDKAPKQSPLDNLAEATPTTDGLTPNQQVQYALRKDLEAADGKFSSRDRVLGMLGDEVSPEVQQVAKGGMKGIGEFIADPTVRSVAGLGLGAAAMTESEDASAMPASIVSKAASLLANAPTAVRNASKEQQDQWLRNQGVKEVDIQGMSHSDAVPQPKLYTHVSPQEEAEVAGPYGGEGYFENVYFSDAMTEAGKKQTDHWQNSLATRELSAAMGMPTEVGYNVPAGGAPAFHARGIDIPSEGRRKVYELQSDAQNRVSQARAQGLTTEGKAFQKGVNWEEDAINRQLVEASNKNFKSVDFLITTDDNSMKRSPRVEQRYQTQYRSQIEKQAKKIGATVEEITEGSRLVSNVTSGQIKPRQAYRDVVATLEQKGYRNNYFNDIASNMNIESPSEYARAVTKVIDDALKDGKLTAEVAEPAKAELAEAVKLMEDELKTGKYAVKLGGNTYLRVALPASFTVPAFAQEPNPEDKAISQQLAKSIEAGQMSYQEAEQVIRDTVPNPQEQEVLLAEAKAKFAPRPELFRPDMSPEMLTAAISKVNSMPFMLSKTVGSLAGNEGFTKDLADYSAQLNSTIVAELAKRGHQARLTQEGEVEVLDQESGKWVEADGGFGTSLMNGLLLSPGEIGGGIGGAIAGARAGAALPLPPQGKAVAALGGGVIGGVTGVFGGSLADQWVSATILKQKLDEKKALNIAAAAGVEDVIIGLGITGLIKGGKATYNSVVNTVAKAKSAVDNFMLQGALKELENITGLTKAQRQELATKLEEVSEKTMARNEARREIEGVLQTRPGMEILVGEASRLSKTAGFGMLKEIDTRAKSVLDATNEMTAGNVSRVVTDELGRYRMSVKKGYEGIKQLGASEAQQAGFRYDPATVIDVPKLIDDAEAGITDPSKLSRLDAFTARIAKIGAESDKEFGLAELLDYRLALKQFKESGQFNYTANQRAERMLADIDKEIAKAVDMMPNGKAWQEQFKQANIEYSKMKALEENVMYKALNKPGASADDTVRALAKYIKAEDGTFMKVMGKLPPHVRNNVEGAVIRNYATKYTAGDEQGFQAIDFPGLARDLDGINFTTKGGQDLKRVVDKLAKVYQNDQALAAEAGAIQMPKNKTYLATSISGRLNMAAHNQLFNYVSRYLPTQQGRTRRLAEAISDVLDNPLNAKSVEKLTRELPGDPNLKTTLQQLSISYAERGQRETYPKVPLYKVYQEGYSQSTKQTKYGDGIEYFTSKEAAEKAKASGQTVEEVLVEPSRYATIDQAGMLLGRELTPEDLKQARVVQDLKKHGFLGIADGDLVFEFK